MHTFKAYTMSTWITIFRF